MTLDYCLTAIRPALVTLALLAGGCSWQPLVPEPRSEAAERVVGRVPPPATRAGTSADAPLGHSVVSSALAVVGSPYLWGGDSPDGFDCSGLVQYAYAQNGVAVPRTSRAQRAAFDAIVPSRAAPGDLLFFETPGKGSHVAIVIGDGEFVHAPSSGKFVSRDSLANNYYRRHLVGAGRLSLRRGGR